MSDDEGAVTLGYGSIRRVRLSAGQMDAAVDAMARADGFRAARSRYQRLLRAGLSGLLEDVALRASLGVDNTTDEGA